MAAAYGFNQSSDLDVTLPSTSSQCSNFCASAKSNSSPNTYSIDSAALISSGTSCGGAGGSAPQGVQYASRGPEGWEGEPCFRGSSYPCGHRCARSSQSRCRSRGYEQAGTWYHNNCIANLQTVQSPNCWSPSGPLLWDPSTPSRSASAGSYREQVDCKYKGVGFVYAGAESGWTGDNAECKGEYKHWLSETEYCCEQ